MEVFGRADQLLSAYRRWRFFRNLDAAFAAMTPEELADYRAEATLLSGALMDGLEVEDWSEFRA